MGQSGGLAGQNLSISSSLGHFHLKPSFCRVFDQKRFGGNRFPQGRSHFSKGSNGFLKGRSRSSKGGQSFSQREESFSPRGRSSLQMSKPFPLGEKSFPRWEMLFPRTHFGWGGLNVNHGDFRAATSPARHTNHSPRLQRERNQARSRIVLFCGGMSQISINPTTRL